MMQDTFCWPYFCWGNWSNLCIRVLSIYRLFCTSLAKFISMTSIWRALSTLQWRLTAKANWHSSCLRVNWQNVWGRTAVSGSIVCTRALFGPICFEIFRRFTSSSTTSPKESILNQKLELRPHFSALWKKNLNTRLYRDIFSGKYFMIRR